LKFHDVITDGVRSVSTIREDHLDIPHRRTLSRNISLFREELMEKKQFKTTDNRQTDRQIR